MFTPAGKAQGPKFINILPQSGRRVKWTSDDDTKLVDYIADEFCDCEEEIIWDSVALLFNDRTARQCSNRWKKLNQQKFERAQLLETERLREQCASIRKPPQSPTKRLQREAIVALQKRTEQQKVEIELLQNDQAYSDIMSAITQMVPEPPPVPPTAEISPRKTWSSTGKNTNSKQRGPAKRRKFRSKASAMQNKRECPRDLCCPITKVVMKEPVILTADGYTYEKAAITMALRRRRRSPMTNQFVNDLRMIPNLNMRSQIASWLSEHRPRPA